MLLADSGGTTCTNFSFCWVLLLRTELLPQHDVCEQCEHMQSPLSDCESMLTEFDDPNNHRYYANNHHMHHLHHLHHNQQQAQHLPPPAMFYAPPPPEHPPLSDVEPDSPTMNRLRGAYHP